MVRNRLVFALALACAAPAAIAASPVEPVLVSRPNAAVTSLPAGLSRLGNGAVAYRPDRLAPGAAPLVVILHGRGGPSSRLLAEFKPEADARGLILLAPRSSETTWDLIIDAARYGGGRPREGASLRFGRDVARIDSALAEIFANAAIDPQRIVLAGFSDGASYALSLGLANPTLFRGIVAMSPGLMVAPDEADDTQRLFITHGRSDRVIPIKVSRDGLARALADAGMNVRFHQFNGSHEVDRKALREGLHFALGAAAQ